MTSAPDKVWISPSFINTEIFKKLRVITSDKPGNADPDPEKEAHLASVSRQYKNGYSLAEADIPKAFAGMYRDTWVSPMPDFSYGNGFFLLSERCANVFRQFDLGTGGLFPVDVYQGSRKSLVKGGPIFLLDFGCRKDSFMPEESKLEKFDLWTKPPMQWAPRSIEDDDCAVNHAALEGPDLWVEARVGASFFMSDRLAEELRKAKVAKNIRMRRCRMVE
jgi:hypothetical protein